MTEEKGQIDGSDVVFYIGHGESAGKTAQAVTLPEAPDAPLLWPRGRRTRLKRLRACDH